MDRKEILKLENQFCFSVYSLSKEMIRVYKPYLEKLNLTYTQYITMLVLWEQDGLKVNEIGEKIQLDSGTLTPLLKKLEQKEFVERKRQKKDERNLIVTLTEKGKALQDDAVEIPKEIFKKLGMPLEKLLEIRDTLKDLNQTIMKI